MCFSPENGAYPTVMRYYFHLVSDSLRIPDDVGVEAGSANEAYLGALKALDDLRGELKASDGRHWNLEVTDSSDRVIVTIALNVQRP